MADRARAADVRTRLSLSPGPNRLRSPARPQPYQRLVDFRQPPAPGAQFEAGWNQSDSYSCGNFRGEVIGYIAATIAIIIISGGAAAEGVAFASMSRWGKVVKIIQTLDNAGDIVGWAQKAGRRLPLPRRILDRIHEATRGDQVYLDAPGNEPDLPDGHGKHSPSEGGAGNGDVSPRQDEPDFVPDRTREPYVDPSEDPYAPRRPLDRRELIPHRKLDVKKSWKEIEQAQKAGDLSFAIGPKLKTPDAGHEILARLSSGDASALEKLGIHDYPRDLDPTGREWALIEVRDGFAIYAGEYRRIELPPNSRILAHTHPGPDPNLPEPTEGPKIDRRIRPEADGKTMREVLSDLKNARESGVIPSAADLNAISDGTPHVLYTRYVSSGDGTISNPLPGDTRPRVQMHLSDSKVVRWDPRRKSYYYEVNAVARDASGKELWSGKIYAAWHAPIKGGDVWVDRPAVLDRPLPEGWRGR